MNLAFMTRDKKILLQSAEVDGRTLFPEGAVFLGLKVLWFLRRRRRSGRGASAISSQEKPRVEVEERGENRSPRVSANLLPRAKKLIFSSDPPGEDGSPRRARAGDAATAAGEDEERSCRVYI